MNKKFFEKISKKGLTNGKSCAIINNVVRDNNKNETDDTK